MMKPHFQRLSGTKRLRDIAIRICLTDCDQQSSLRTPQPTDIYMAAVAEKFILYTQPG